MKKLLVILGVFAFISVMAASDTKNWSGYLLDQNDEFVSSTTIHCQQTNSTVVTNLDGSFEGLKVQSNSRNTLNFTSSTGQSLGSTTIDAGSSDMSDQIIRIPGSSSR